MSPEVEAYCKNPWAFCTFPVLPNCSGATHWVLLLPVLETLVLSETAPDFSASWPVSKLTWAMAGTATSSPIANVTANIINFFNFYCLLFLRQPLHFTYSTSL
jgi:hypothetical protein